MLIIGIACLILGFILGIKILWIIGVVLAVLGAVLLVLGHSRSASYTGRRYWY